MEKPAWSQNQLKRLGFSIRDGVSPSAALPAYADVLTWYNDLAAEVQRVIADHDWRPTLGDRPFEVTSRAKTVDTLRQKLQRDRATPLASIQDLAGVRFEAKMSLDEQDQVATEIAALFSHDPESSIHDMRAAPHSGYRAVHVWLRVSGRVEVQIRTHLQSSWANAYEACADAVGRGIRYDEMPTDPEVAKIVQVLQAVSTVDIVKFEEVRNAAGQLKAEYATLLKGLDNYGDEDTLPRGLVEAQEAAVRMDELEATNVGQENQLREALAEIKRMFDAMSKGGS